MPKNQIACAPFLLALTLIALTSCSAPSRRGEVKPIDSLSLQEVVNDPDQHDSTPPKRLIAIEFYDNKKKLYHSDEFDLDQFLKRASDLHIGPELFESKSVYQTTKLRIVETFSVKPLLLARGESKEKDERPCLHTLMLEDSAHLLIWAAFETVGK